MEQLPPPDLNDAAQRAAYRRELRGVVRPLRYAALALFLVGSGAIYWHRYIADQPGYPAWGVAMAALGLAGMITGIVIRTRYHRARLRGEG